MLTLSDIRRLAQTYAITPTKTLGQNFVHDHGTLHAIAAAAKVGPGSRVVEVGPGLGSLTLALLATGAEVSAIEIDQRLAAALPTTLRTWAPDDAQRAAVTCGDALHLTGARDLAVPPQSATDVFTPTALVANLPYNVAVPILLTMLEVLPTITTAVVMVQAEVANRLVAKPGSRIYGVPSVKCQWYGSATRIKTVGRHVFWPIPNVDSAVVELQRSAPPPGGLDVGRAAVFTLIDHAFAQRRKTLRAALAPWAGSAAASEVILRRAGIDPQLRGERLQLADFIAIAQAATGEQADG